MKFGAIAVIIGVIIIVIGFAAPTMQIATASNGVTHSLTGSVSVSKSTYTSGSSIPLTFRWTSETNDPTAIWSILEAGSGQPRFNVFSLPITTQSGSHTYYWSGEEAGHIYYFSVSYMYDYPLESGVGGFASFSISGPTPTSSLPEIKTISGTPNPATVGQTVTFTASVDWKGDVGRLIWTVNGNLISGNTYTFTNTGKYIIQASASNSAGSTSSANFYEVIGTVSAPPSPVITEISGSPNPAVVGGTVTLTADVNWEGQQTGTVSWVINANTVNPISISSTTVFKYAGTYTITAIAKNNVGSFNASFVEVVNPDVTVPTIDSVYGTPNPAQVGQTATFTADVNWNGQVGTETWYINGQAISGSSYTFNSAGTYTILVKATNSAGTSSNSFSEVINTATPPPGPEILSASGSPNPAKVGETVTFTADINWNGNTGTVMWEINNNSIYGDTYTFNTAGTYTITAIASNSIGTSSNSFNEVVNVVINPPVITDVYGTPNPIIVGAPVSFISSVNWNGQTGTVTWEVTTNTISGNTYIFSTSGNYTVTAIAKNSAGTDYKSFIEIVNPIITPKSTTPQLKNVGTFYMVANGKVYNLEGTPTINISTITYPVSSTIYYVENHGTTQNLSGIIIKMNSNNLTLSLSNKTTYNGLPAYALQFNLQAGNYTLTGYLSVLHNNSAPIQAFSLLLDNSHLMTETQDIESNINYTAIIVGILVMIGGAVLIRFGI